MAAIPTSQKKPPIPTPGVCQVEMIYWTQGIIAENVYHVIMNAGGTPATEAQMDSLAATFNQWEVSQATSQRGQNTRLQMIRVRRLDSTTDLVKEYTPVGNVTGLGTSPQCSSNVTTAIRWSTGQGGRSFRGRTYHIGMVNSYVNGNQLQPAAQAALGVCYAALMTAVASNAGQKLAVLSYAHNKFWRTTGLATPITASSVHLNVDSQRRRLQGRGT